MSGLNGEDMVVRLPKKMVMQAKQRKVNISEILRIELEEAFKTPVGKNVKVTVTVPREMRKKAKGLYVCIGETARKALAKELRLGEA